MANDFSQLPLAQDFNTLSQSDESFYSPSLLYHDTMHHLTCYLLEMIFDELTHILESYSFLYFLNLVYANLAFIQ